LSRGIGLFASVVFVITTRSLRS